MHPLFHPRRSGRGATVILVLCALLCSLGVFAVTPSQPTGLLNESTAAVRSPPSSPLAPPRVTARRTTLVREVDRHDWYLLDGDQLLPGHPADNPDVPPTRRHARRRQAAHDSAIADAAAKANAPVSVILSEPRRPASPRHRDAVRSASPPPPQQQQQQQIPPRLISVVPVEQPDAAMRWVKAIPAVPAKVAPHAAEQTDDTAKIALKSLRLVVHVTDDKSEEGNEEGRAFRETHSHGRRSEPRALDGGRSLHHSHPSRLLRAGGPAPHLGPSPDKTEADIRLHTTAKSAAAITAHAASSPAEGVKTTPAYTDEELSLRCVVANGRDADPAVLLAMMEGRLRKDCLIVAADVGNDIPTSESNVKGAMTLAFLFVSTLFVAFNFMF
ncbi:hypothetical protein ABB37_07157 [Leptomonas pyrrhocoris]|uniref:GPI-anchored surface protein n=1 Tax=Leptomonas pyrrhocoris TaxID=157538 RepID=A0A0N0DTE0_LEPPY|nr:hypothetical protein ABB37_07157 [Leptomonas pyrrhocoris]XP_015655700.1 hypothetical protein ABB37_07157 [Leptomonas pyrrhocoris]KPA77260.1 hypothetical protein ABB37_07157 [Leptomonas pyrrhocoris]KPA77261.1 hypothetical protein ABB37_07157 [Leptomonas pyrrhocoris]|eukprot:XP_015655699.1 hypothetical protein ABB37_07157 [Leptomonas pyrrhocoris]